VVTAIGVDRHGRLSPLEVSVLPSDHVASEHFLGTRAAFGAFHAETVLVDAAGGRRSVSSIAELQEAWSTNWENCVYAPDLIYPSSAIEQLWDAIGSLALAGNRDAMIVRRFDVGLVGKRRLTRVARSDLERRGAESGLAGISNRIKSLLLAEADLAVANRRAYRLAMWLATCLQAGGDGYRLDYDSLQHTCTVKMKLDATVGQVDSLRTAFLAGVANRSVVSWSDRTWNPISSGFILDGRL
jgi:hypothetical protein